MILGTIVVLRDSLSPLAIEQLLDLEPKSVRMTLTHLHSVIIVPEDDISVIRLLHPSFDFITNALDVWMPDLWLTQRDNIHCSLMRV
jgi:hypothetical protein